MTDLLREWGQGEANVSDELLNQLYDELRRIASAKVRGERKNHTLQPTALVHEAYMRLHKEKRIQWQSRAHFLGFAARLMHQILVEYARARKSLKRGGGARSATLVEMVGSQSTPTDILALEDALQELAQLDPQKALIVELKFFGGLTLAETAEFLKISESTVSRSWRMARAWLYRSLSGGRDERPSETLEHHQ